MTGHDLMLLIVSVISIAEGIYACYVTIEIARLKRLLGATRAGQDGNNQKEKSNE